MFNSFMVIMEQYSKRAPAYGFRDRMKADSVFPNKSVAGKLTQIDTFKKTVISDLLD
ncbi:hypothetical protein MKX03_008979 [Papaver bracteatum]|nr:hypothetical protein MKX03_008979 [Papaver bracteatum]